MSRSPSVGERTTTVLNMLSCLDIPIGHYKMLPWQRERQKSNRFQCRTYHCISTPLQSIYITTLPVLFYRMAFL